MSYGLTECLRELRMKEFIDCEVIPRVEATMAYRKRPIHPEHFSSPTTSGSSERSHSWHSWQRFAASPHYAT
jgi:hypothetical protein